MLVPNINEGIMKSLYLFHSGSYPFGYFEKAGKSFIEA